MILYASHYTGMIWCKLNSVKLFTIDWYICCKPNWFLPTAYNAHSFNVNLMSIDNVGGTTGAIVQVSWCISRTQVYVTSMVSHAYIEVHVSSGVQSFTVLWPGKWGNLYLAHALTMGRNECTKLIVNKLCQSAKVIGAFSQSTYSR